MKEPTLAAKQHSELVCQEINRHIASSGGSIDFATFMQLALYAPQLGYYTAGCQKFGPTGDFITAPLIGDMLAHCLAKQCHDLFSDTKCNILELGAGTGDLAKQLLAQLPSIASYTILETSADLKSQQQQLLKNVNWLNRLPDRFNGIIIANEVLDALPVHCFSIENQQVLAKHIAYANENFYWKTISANSILSTEVRKLPVLSYSDYQSEICLMLPAFIKSLLQSLQQGYLIFIDYGFLQEEYYHSERNRGTLMCHYQHHAHSDPLLYPGLQDITAHVNFSSVIDTIEQHGAEVVYYNTLANFLMERDITAVIEHKLTSVTTDLARLHIQQEVNLLLSPAEMGELQKVLIVQKT